MPTLVTRGANTWQVHEGGGAYMVSRTRGSDSNDQPRGWVWRVRSWRDSAGGPRGFARPHWHTLPAHGPKAARVIAIVERMLDEVR